VTAHRQMPADSGIAIRQEAPGGRPDRQRDEAARDMTETVVVNTIDRVCALHAVRSLPAVRIEADGGEPIIGFTDLGENT